MGGGFAGRPKCCDIGQEEVFFRPDMFGEIVDVSEEEVAEGGQDGMVGFIVVGKEPDALFDLGEFFSKIEDVGALDVVYNDLNGVGFEIGCAENLLFKYANEGGNEFHLVTGQGWLGDIPLHYLGIEIAVFGHWHTCFKSGKVQKYGYSV